MKTTLTIEVTHPRRIPPDRVAAAVDGIVRAGVDACGLLIAPKEQILKDIAALECIDHAEPLVPDDRQ